jgi:hypothetical protein
MEQQQQLAIEDGSYILKLQNTAVIAIDLGTRCTTSAEICNHSCQGSGMYPDIRPRDERIHSRAATLLV